MPFLASFVVYSRVMEIRKLFLNTGRIVRLVWSSGYCWNRKGSAQRMTISWITMLILDIRKKHNDWIEAFHHSGENLPSNTLRCWKSKWIMWPVPQKCLTNPSFGMTMILDFTQKNKCHYNSALGVPFAARKTVPVCTPFWCHFQKGRRFCLLEVPQRPNLPSSLLAVRLIRTKTHMKWHKWCIFAARDSNLPSNTLLCWESKWIMKNFLQLLVRNSFSYELLLQG